MKMGARSWLPLSSSASPSSSSVPYQRQSSSSPPIEHHQEQRPHAAHPTPPSAATTTKTTTTTGTRSSSPASASPSPPPPLPPSPAGKRQHRHQHVVVAPISHPLDRHHHIFPIAGVGGALASGGPPGGLPERARGPAAAVALATAAAHQAAERHLAVRRDLALDLPPCPALPDGEERPYGASARLRVRDFDQESEIYRECIRPPPNRTVQQTPAMTMMGGASFPPSRCRSNEGLAMAPSSACSTTSLLSCCSAPSGCCAYRNRNSANHLHRAHRRKAATHHIDASVDPKHPDGLLSARFEAPAPALSVMVPSGGGKTSFVKSLRERVNQNNKTDIGWPPAESSSRSKLATLTVVTCSAAASLDKPADAHA